MRTAFALLFTSLVLTASAVAQDKPQFPGPTESGFLLPNGWHLTPVGKHVETTDLPLNIIPLKDGKHAVVATSGFNSHNLYLIDLAENKVVAFETVRNSWFGLALSQAEDKVWWSGGGQVDLHTFGLKNAKFTKKAGDPNLVDLFGRMVSALNDSGFLIYLKPVDKDNPGSRVVFTIKQGETEVLATVESEASSIDSARLLAKGFNAALAFGAQSRAGKDEEALLRNTSAEPVGKKIVFNFTMPRQAVVDLIKKQLAPDKPS